MSLRDRLNASPHAKYVRTRRESPAPVPAVLEPVRFTALAIAVAALTLLATCVGGMACGTMIAKAQPRAESLDVALARVCIAEAGWAAIDTGECAAIHAVACSRSERRHVTVDRALRDYASEHFDSTRERRRWVLGLVASGDRPRDWPSSMAWPRYRERWLATIAHAGKVIRGEVDVPCESRPDHWGAPHGGDLERAQRAGWQRIRCAEGVRNAYWSMRRGGA